jgi:serine/threonine protein kinase
MHKKHIIHRDIKPDNFVMGFGDNNSLVYTIDFGLSKKFRSSKTLQHIAMRTNKKLTGTARYASINTLSGVEQSRRDDLEAIGYVLMYFLRGSLPWQGLKVDKREDRYKKICEKKKATSPEDLCTGFPDEFAQYIHYTRKLGFDQEPDYDILRGYFKTVMDKNGWKFDNVFDWTTTPEVANSTVTSVTDPKVNF